MSNQDRICELISREGPMSREELYRRFKVNRGIKRDFNQLLKRLTKEGRLVLNDKNQYTTADESDLILGTIQGNTKGFGFLIPEDPSIEDIYIHESKLNTAMDGDKVLVKEVPHKFRKESVEGVVTKVLERANKQVVGIYEDAKDCGFVIPDSARMIQDIYIPKKKRRRARNGQKVVVKIEKWPMGNKKPEGKIVKILGYPDEKDVDVLSIAYSMGLPMEFSREVMAEATRVPTKANSGQLARRKDMRDWLTVTIDGPDAKDLDDAISLDILDNGNYQLGVHIADVAEYVKEDSAIDKEAYLRGNSVYLINEVIPMLPRELSNGICSLNEGEDRLTMSLIAEVDPQGRLHDYELVEGIIKTGRRLSYPEVSDYLEDGTDHPSLEGLHDMLDHMEILSKAIRKRRQERGNINFDFDEPLITIDEDGVPIDIQVEDRRVANEIIEDFMLLANETVAERYHRKDVPFLYRVHEEPSEEKLKELNIIMRPFGYKLDLSEDVTPRQIQALTEAIEGKDEEALISTVILRSMQKAHYSESSLGHFGLAARYYAHFTAPIRRYNDLIVHRIIKLDLKNKYRGRVLGKYERKLPQIAKHISNTERQAQEAERKVQDVKIAQYMKDRIGEVYPAKVSGITNFGIFAQLDNTIEGLISYAAMTDDHYVFDEENYKAVGKSRGKVYTMGQKVKVEVTGANPIMGKVDFIFVGDDHE